MAKGPQHSKLIKDSHNTVEDIKQLLIAQLQRDQLMNGPKNWPRLKNVDRYVKRTVHLPFFNLIPSVCL